MNDIETLYEKYKDESRDHMVDLELPNDLKEENIGVLPSIIQFISTIIRDGKLNQLKARIKSSNKEQLDSAAKSYLWFVSSSLHWFKEFNYEDGNSLKVDLRPTNQYVNELMRNYKPLGTSYMLTCFDHLPNEKGLVKMFYNAPSYKIVDEEMIEQYVNQIIKNLGEKTNKVVMGKMQGILKPLTAIIYELFRNTDDWATKDRFGNKAVPGVRGIYFRYYKNFQKNIKQHTEDNAALNRYFSHGIFKPDAENKISFLEISVFDSGDGFVGRRMGEKYDEAMPLAEEVSIIKQCLTKYWTNDEGRKGIVKGIGLDRVLSIIDERGFIRIRTNKAHVFRDMIINKYENETVSENITLYDWGKISDKEFTSYYNTKGSVITIILPLEPVVNY